MVQSEGTAAEGRRHDSLQARNQRLWTSVSHVPGEQDKSGAAGSAAGGIERRGSQAVARRGQETGLGQEGSLGKSAFGCPIWLSQGNGADLAPSGLGWGGLVTFLWKITALPGPSTVALHHPEPSAARSLPQLPQQKPGERTREADPSVPSAPDDALPDYELVSEQSPLENSPVTSTARGRYPKATFWCKAQPGGGLSAKHLPRRATREIVFMHFFHANHTKTASASSNTAPR